MQNTVKRRTFLAGMAAVLLGISSPAAYALESSKAMSFVENVTSEVLALVQSPAPRAAKEAEFIAIMERSANLRQIAGFSLGKFRRDMSDAQKGPYIAAFKKLIAKTYVNLFDEYKGEQIRIIRSRKAGGGDVVVDSEVLRAGDLPVNVGWRVSDRSGTPKILDLTVEGVSTALSQRSEFTSQIKSLGGDLDAFIAQLEARVAN